MAKAGKLPRRSCSILRESKSHIEDLSQPLEIRVKSDSGDFYIYYPPKWEYPSPKLNSEVVEGKNLKASDLYQRFFSAVRSNKEHEANLGEELISICAHILSYLP